MAMNLMEASYSMEARIDEDGGKLNIGVRSQDGRVIHFRTNSNTSVSKLLKIYCKRRNMDYTGVVFLLEGEHFDKSKTPAELRLMDGSTIEVFVHQCGGGCKSF